MKEQLVIRTIKDDGAISEEILADTENNDAIYINDNEGMAADSTQMLIAIAGNNRPNLRELGMLFRGMIEANDELVDLANAEGERLQAKNHEIN